MVASAGRRSNAPTVTLALARRHHVPAPRHPGPAQHPESGVQQRCDQHLAAAAAAPRALRGEFREARRLARAVAVSVTLAHAQEMTLSWCMRRAELVLKCVKGFVLEAAGWGGAELQTLHFLLPPDTRADLFTALAHQLPNIFRLSNPVKGKPPSAAA